MIRQEKRRKAREYEKELSFIKKHTPYKQLKKSFEFNLPVEETGMLMDGVHEDRVLQERFYLAKEIFKRVDWLTQMITALKKPNNTKVRRQNL
jgi:hypothetical protein